METPWFFNSSQKAKQSASVGNVMANVYVFRDYEGVIIIDCLEKIQTINGSYYASELQ